MADAHGDFFAPGCDAAFDRAVEQGREDVADVTFNRLHRILAGELKHPTGYYQHHVVDLSFPDRNVITDSDVVYGPWLEGVSTRNRETRFKGYQAFRRATQSMDNRAAEIVALHVDRAVVEVNT